MRRYDKVMKSRGETSPPGEIFFFAICASVGVTILVTIVNEYWESGLWNLLALTLRKAYIISLAYIMIVYGLLAIVKRYLEGKAGIIARKSILVLFVFFPMVSALDYSSPIRRIVHRNVIADVMTYLTAFVAAFSLMTLIEFVRERDRLMRRWIGKTLIPSAVLGIAACILPSFAGEEKAGGNILLITIDTLRADHLGCYGYVRDTSPRIDRFARMSYVYTNPIVQWPKTSPSFSSILTSLYCSQTGVTSPRQRLSSNMTTTAEILRNTGYNTAAVVGNGNLAKRYNFNQGFSIYIEAWKDEKIESGKACTAQHITDLSLRVLQDLAREGGFFMWIHYIDPHAPYNPPSNYNGMFVGDKYFGDKRIKLNEGFNDDIGGCPLRSRLGENDNLYYYIAQYDAEIRYCDSQLGRILDFLESKHLIRSTMVIITSDHGESLGEHNYYFEHGKFPYDATLRVPLIVYVPSLGEGRIDSPVPLLDIHPTILEFAGVGGDGPWEGRSLFAQMREETGARRGVFSQSGGVKNPVWAVRRGKWKLIHTSSSRYRNLMSGAPYELYDLENDPAETVNLSGAGVEVENDLREVLNRWIEETKEGIEMTEEQVDVFEKSTNENLRALGYIED